MHVRSFVARTRGGIGDLNFADILEGMSSDDLKGLNIPVQRVEFSYREPNADSLGRIYEKGIQPLDPVILTRAELVEGNHSPTLQISTWFGNLEKGRFVSAGFRVIEPCFDETTVMSQLTTETVIPAFTDGRIQLVLKVGEETSIGTRNLKFMPEYASLAEIFQLKLNEINLPYLSMGDMTLSEIQAWLEAMREDDEAAWGIRESINQAGPEHLTSFIEDAIEYLGQDYWRLITKLTYSASLSEVIGLIAGKNLDVLSLSDNETQVKADPRLWKKYISHKALSSTLARLSLERFTIKLSELKCMVSEDLDLSNYGEPEDELVIGIQAIYNEGVQLRIYKPMDEKAMIDSYKLNDHFNLLSKAYIVRATFPFEVFEKAEKLDG